MILGMINLYNSSLDPVISSNNISLLVGTTMRLGMINFYCPSLLSVMSSNNISLPVGLQ